MTLARSLSFAAERGWLALALGGAALALYVRETRGGAKSLL